jgi:hypothetical protein
MKNYLNQLDFKEEDNIYLLIDNKINKENSYKVCKLEMEEGGTFYDGFEVKIFAYLQDNKTFLIEKYQIAFFSAMNRIKSIYAFNVINVNKLI